MPYLFLILIIVLPLLEIYVLIKMAGLIGAIPTIALAFSAAIILDALVDILKGRHA